MILLPFGRSTIGFDRLFDLVDAAQHGGTEDNYPPCNVERTCPSTFRPEKEPDRLPAPPRPDAARNEVGHRWVKFTLDRRNETSTHKRLIKRSVPFLENGTHRGKSRLGP